MQGRKLGAWWCTRREGAQCAVGDILARAKETYKELDKEGKVTTVALAKEMNTEVVSPSFMEFTRERAQMIYDNGGWRNWRKYCGLINKLDAFRKKRRMADITVPI